MAEVSNKPWGSISESDYESERRLSEVLRSYRESSLQTYRAHDDTGKGSMRYTKSLKDMVGSAEGKRWQERALAERQSKRGTRPAHLIRPDEVDAWLAESVNKVVTYHRTSRLAAQDILEQGVNISRIRTGAYGLGFYTATSSDPFHGEVEMAVAVRTVRPLMGHASEIGDLVDATALRLFGRRLSMTSAVAQAVRREFLNLGYDGMIIRGMIIRDAGGDGIDYVVALEGGAVKVIQR